MLPDFESQGFSFPKLAGRETEKPHDTHSRGAVRFQDSPL